MVRRRGKYKVSIRKKLLVCPNCQNDVFEHREVYIDLSKYSKEMKEQLTLQSFNCTLCGEMRLFEEKKQYDHAKQEHVSTIEYVEVKETWG